MGNRNFIKSEICFNLSITYGVASERRKATFKQNTNDVQWTRYYASEYDKTIFADGHSRELHYISGPSGLVAINVRNSAATEDSLYFVFKDHLGSLTTITDKNGSVLQQLNYNLWGKRSIAGGNYTSCLFDRGFTGHEHLDMFGLINMNGRVYDPLLGRFLSPDNYVQGGGSQAFNRYTYCRNNPLKYTDPSGWISDRFAYLLRYFHSHDLDGTGELWTFGEGRKITNRGPGDGGADGPVGASGGGGGGGISSGGVSSGGYSSPITDSKKDEENKNNNNSNQQDDPVETGNDEEQNQQYIYEPYKAGTLEQYNRLEDAWYPYPYADKPLSEQPAVTFTDNADLHMETIDGTLYSWGVPENYLWYDISPKTRNDPAYSIIRVRGARGNHGITGPENGFLYLLFK